LQQQFTVRTLRDLSKFFAQTTISLAQKRPDGELLPFANVNNCENPGAKIHVGRKRLAIDAKKPYILQSIQAAAFLKS
jgi:hypothetical protein